MSNVMEHDFSILEQLTSEIDRTIKQFKGQKTTVSVTLYENEKPPFLEMNFENDRGWAWNNIIPAMSVIQLLISTDEGSVEEYFSFEDSVSTAYSKMIGKVEERLLK